MPHSLPELRDSNFGAWFTEQQRASTIRTKKHFATATWTLYINNVSTLYVDLFHHIICDFTNSFVSYCTCYHITILNNYDATDFWMMAQLLKLNSFHSQRSPYLQTVKQIYPYVRAQEVDELWFVRRVPEKAIGELLYQILIQLSMQCLIKTNLSFRFFPKKFHSIHAK